MLWLLKVGLLAYAGFGALLYFGQRSMMYLPVGENPADDLSVEWVSADDARLKLWVVGESADHAVIYFGGNAEDVYFNAAPLRQRLPGASVYLVNYRGYGGSSGEPSEAALFADALRVFDHVAARHARVSVVGRSLGSGVATFLAAQREVHRLVLVTPPDSALAIAQRLYPVYPMRLMLKDRFESTRHAATVRAPVLVLVAADDTLIPPQHSRRLAESFTSTVVQYTEISDAGHNDIGSDPGYWESLAGFLVD
ncbi:MAG: alpha/beta fold hydrolase [Gammaproteobacteria bacterium]|nr:alpha/beta fold hydrolase [Gammaproteobacteria bacterium]